MPQRLGCLEYVFFHDEFQLLDFVIDATCSFLQCCNSLAAALRALLTQQTEPRGMLCYELNAVVFKDVLFGDCFVGYVLLYVAM